MDDAGSATARRRRRRVGPFVVGVGLIVGAFALGAVALRPVLMPHHSAALSLPPLDLPSGGLSVAPPPPPRPPSRSHPQADQAPFGLPHATPVTVSVPRVGIDARLTNVGLDAKGSVIVPKDNTKAGWYADGPAPGDADTDMPAVIVGHVDSYRGPAVFFTLRQVRPGDRVSVRRADGSSAVFVVYRVAEYLKTKFPAAQVFAQTSRPELRLITCTGEFDRSARSYLSDFVAYAVLQRPVPARHPRTGGAVPSAAPTVPSAPSAPAPSVRTPSQPSPTPTGAGTRVAPVPRAAAARPR